MRATNFFREPSHNGEKKIITMFFQLIFTRLKERKKKKEKKKKKRKQERKKELGQNDMGKKIDVMLFPVVLYSYVSKRISNMVHKAIGS